MSASSPPLPSGPVLVGAQWVIPIDAPIIEKGGLVMENGRIIALGKFRDVEKQYPQAKSHWLGHTVLMPALVNAHIHLELSHLAALAGKPFPGSFTQWIVDMLALREEAANQAEERLGSQGPIEQILHAAEACLEQQYATGVSLIADIGNTGLISHLSDAFPGTLYCMKEYLGFSTRSLDHSLPALAREQEAIYCTGHAPYSTHPQLLHALKQRASQLNQLFSIHTAEPLSEQDLLRHRTGELVSFLQKKGFWDEDFVGLPLDKICARGACEGGSILYMDHLHLLDERTLCVHAIHVSDQEMDILAKRKAHVCLCPGSNDFLQVGTAPLDRYLQHGITPCLGTDSAASNPELSLWREIALLAEKFPMIEHEVFLHMATLSGAQALGLDHSHGSLSPGKFADILVIPCPETLASTAAMLDMLVHDTPSLDRLENTMSDMKEEKGIW